MPELITVKVDRKTRARLAKLATETKRSESRLVAEAIRSYVDINEWHIQKIKEGIKEADAGNFASEEEVQALLEKWKKRAR